MQMQWIHEFQLFLFDFDGLLVNTEEIHYLAYQRMFAGRGVHFDWKFDQYCRVAHYSADGLKNCIYEEYPILKATGPSWDVLYAEKKQAIIELFIEGAVHTMPGVEHLLTVLQDASIPRCVVTHSALELVNAVKRKNPILETIPFWVTREYYSQPKPHSECYEKAIKMYAKESDSVIGFEDTPRGMQALSGTRALPVMICEANYPEISAFVARGAYHFPRFDTIPNDMVFSSSHA
jgi:HAD superfamily hydrolase (TIGR01509 family)